MKQQIEEIVRRIDKKHLNDPTKAQDWEEIEELFSGSMEATIACLNSLGENEIATVSFCFEDLAPKFRDDKFIDCIKGLVIKYPDIGYLKKDVEFAIEAM